MNDHRRDPEQIEADIEYTRERIDQTISALEHQFSPGQLVDRALGYTRAHGTDFADNLVSTVSRNPIPALMAGVGLAWLAASRNRVPPAEEYHPLVEGSDAGYTAAGGRYRAPGGTAYETGSDDDDEPSRTERAKERVGSAASSAADSARRAGASVRRGAHDARESMSHAASRARSAASRAGHGISGGAHSAADQLQQWHEDNPLVMGGLAFALGAALGAATPNTRREDELMGEYGERARDRVAREARRQEAKVADKAADAAESAREKVQEAGSRTRERQREVQRDARSRATDRGASSAGKPSRTDDQDSRRPGEPRI